MRPGLFCRAAETPPALPLSTYITTFKPLAASEIQEGDQLSSAVLNSDSFFEQDLEGMSEVTVGLYGNAQDGYMFKIDSWK